jgi:8-oxo-dGTP pyrophosphatase MutT (NUDIX family)
MVRSGEGLEVLMVKRPVRGFFGGLMVFPGGAVEDCDRAWSSHHPDSEFRVAGVRETAEEVGFVITESGFVPSPPLRGAELLSRIAGNGERPGLDRLILISRWLTPRTAPTRFDTRFYLVSFEGDPEVVVDQAEIEDHVWIAPDEALRRSEDGAWSMILPTVAHLRWLRRWATAEQAVMAARGADGMTIIEPIARDGELLVRYRAAE